LLVLLFVSALLVVRLIVGGTGPGGGKFTIGRFVLSASNLDSVQLKAWLLFMVGVGVATSGGIIYLLRRVFDNMTRAEIFTADNVRHIRRISLIILGVGVWQFVMPVLDAMLFANSAFAPASVTFSVPVALLPFLVAGFIYLVSWIMEVGLGVSTEAAELRRDAELVV
jgi:nitrate reductase gamma subunit